MNTGASNSNCDSTSRSLLVRAKSNDPQAWNRIVDLYAPLVVYWCRRSKLPKHDVADVFQEVFRAAAASISGFRKQDAGDSFRGWLRTITRNKIHDHFNRAKREPPGIGGTDIQMQFARVPAEPPSGDDLSDETAANADLLHRALDEIRGHFKDHTWQAFWRLVIDGRPTNDVADELSMSPGAVRVAKTRVLQRLREELGDLIE